MSDLEEAMNTSLKADAELKVFKDAISWAKKFVAAVTIAVVLALGLVIGVGINTVHTYQQQNQKILNEIDSTVVSHNTELAQTLNAACILINSSPQLESAAPSACKKVK
jgi:fumarate hydratase class II